MVSDLFKWLPQINSTENRSVLHVALRAPKDAVIKADGMNVVPEVWNVLDKIKEFSDKIRSGSWVNSRCHYKTYLLTFSSPCVEFFCTN